MFLPAQAQVNFVSASDHNKRTSGGFVLQQTLTTLLAQTAAATLQSHLAKRALGQLSRLLPVNASASNALRRHKLALAQLAHNVTTLSVNNDHVYND